MQLWAAPHLIHHSRIRIARTAVLAALTYNPNIFIGFLRWPPYHGYFVSTPEPDQTAGELLYGPEIHEIRNL